MKSTHTIKIDNIESVIQVVHHIRSLKNEFVSMLYYLGDTQPNIIFKAK
jgi:hypothetical protein